MSGDCLRRRHVFSAVMEPGDEIMPEYINISRERIQKELQGTLKTRPMNREVYDPISAGNKLTNSPWINEKKSKQMRLLEKKEMKYGSK